MPTKSEFQRLMEDSTSFCDAYRSTNIDPAHRRADMAYHGILENEQEYIERKRSALFIPKTRQHCTGWKTTITNAFFMSDDFVTLTNAVAPEKARFTNEVVNLRLDKGRNYRSVHAFISKAADAHVKYGNAIGKVGWEYRSEAVEEVGPDGEVTKYESPETDRPFLELIPFENVQYDYRVISEDPVNDSPFWRQWIPMYVGDVKAKFASREWKKPRGFNWENIAAPASTELVRKSRQGKMQNPSAQSFGSDDVSEYRQIWAVENYFRVGGTDWTFISLGDEYIVTDPERVVDKFAHGSRPYAMSSFDPEAFRSYSDGVPEKGRHLQAEINAIRNQRRDNVSIILNRGHYVRRDAGVQLQSLLAPRPGMVTLGDSITQNDIRPMEMQDVTASAYNEEQITERNFEEISGKSQNRLGVQSADRQTATEAAIEASSGGEYEAFVIKGFSDGFVYPLMCMYIINVVAMESDEATLMDAALATGLPPDPMLLAPCEITINAGMGSTNKELRSMRLATAIDQGIMLAQVDPTFVGTVKELYRERLPLLGIKNVDRFVPPTAQQQGALPQNAGGTGPGATPPASGPMALPPPPGINPALSEAASNSPSLGGMARGMLQ